MFQKFTRTARAAVAPAIATAVATALATPALAHTGAGATHGLAAAIAHPLGGADHFLAMLAVGLLAAAVAGRAWMIPAGFLGGMLAGAGLGFTGIMLPGPELMIAGSVLALGLLVAFGRRLPVLGVASVAAAFALFHGYAHAMESPPASSGLLYVAGFVAGTALLHAAGYAAVRVAGPALARVLLPAGGFLTALAGAGLLAGV